MEKPFLCSQTNCHMTFTNEDRLEVHKRCHEIEMNQHHSINNCPTSIAMKLPTFVIDQTPTPTNCLKHCEDVSLFPEITLNPFDEEFRKASQFKSQLSIPENSAADSLETPKILPLVDSDETISSTSKDVSGCSTSYPNYDSYTNTVCSPSKNSIARIQNPTCGETEKNRKMRLNIHVSPTSESPAGQKLISTPTPVITAGPSVTQNLISMATCSQPDDLFEHYHDSVAAAGNALVQGEPEAEVGEACRASVDMAQYGPALVECSGVGVATSSSEGGPITTHSYAQPIVPSAPATVLQLVLRLPNGQSIPVEIPATPVASSSASTKGSVAQANATIVSCSHVPSQTSCTGSSGTSIAKMKLKQALASCSTAAKPGIVKVSRANTADRIAELTRSRHTSSENYYKCDNSLLQDVGIMEPNVANSSHPRKRRGSAGDDDHLDKRLKFLERNRVAAVRCREKKKKFVKHLFVKSDELEGINQKLQGEVYNLKSEVALLKSLLLQHKDCPVTLAMNNERSGRDAYPKSFTTFKIEQPSGVITQVTTTPIANFSPQSQPEDAMEDAAAGRRQSLEFAACSQAPKILIAAPAPSSAFKGVPVESAARPVAIAPAPGPSQQQQAGQIVMSGSNIRLQPAVSSSSSPSTVILVNHATSSGASTKMMSPCGSKPTFIISKSAVPVTRTSANTLSVRPSTAISSQCVLSLDPSCGSSIYTLDQVHSEKTSPDATNNFRR